MFPSADPAAWPGALDRAEGNFFRAQRHAAGVAITADEFAASPMLHTSAPGLFAASASLFVLARVRRALGHPVDPRSEALASCLWTNSMGHQQFDPRTVVAGFEYVFPGTVVTRDLITRRTTVEHVQLPRTPLASISDQTEAVVESAQRMVQLFAPSPPPA